MIMKSCSQVGRAGRDFCLPLGYIKLIIHNYHLLANNDHSVVCLYIFPSFFLEFFNFQRLYHFYPDFPKLKTISQNLLKTQIAKVLSVRAIFPSHVSRPFINRVRALIDCRQLNVTVFIWLGLPRYFYVTLLSVKMPFVIG